MLWQYYVCIVGDICIIFARAKTESGECDPVWDLNMPETNFHPKKNLIAMSGEQTGGPGCLTIRQVIDVLSRTWHFVSLRMSKNSAMCPPCHEKGPTPGLALEGAMTRCQ